MRRPRLPILIGFMAVTLLAVIGVSPPGGGRCSASTCRVACRSCCKPAEDTDSEQLDQAIEIIRNRVDALGVAEPDISRQGGNIVVSLPGVKDQQRALDLVGTTAELRFRPVLQVLPGADWPPRRAGGRRRVDDHDGAGGDHRPAGSRRPPPPAPTDDDAAGSTTTTATPPSGGQSSLGVEASVSGAPGELALGPTTTAAPATTTTAAPTTDGAPPPRGAARRPRYTTDSTAPAADAGHHAGAGRPTALTSREDGPGRRPVVLPGYDPEDDSVELYRYSLGPALATGEGVDDAQMVLNPQTGEPYVQLTSRTGATGIDAWRAAAAACFGGSAQCPTGQLAIVLDGRVLSAPTGQRRLQRHQHGPDHRPVLPGGGPEPGHRPALRGPARGARAPAGPGGVGHRRSRTPCGPGWWRASSAWPSSRIYILALLPALRCGGHGQPGAVLRAACGRSSPGWARAAGLALTLSGVVGIIVSIGVSIDSNIVYFEVIKDDMRTGRNLRSSAAERAFRSAIRTIIRADAVSLIAAGLLYWLTVGSVRGFAFYLGLATLLDLLAAYFFMRPAVLLLARTRTGRAAPGLVRHPPSPRPTARRAGRSAARALPRGGGGRSDERRPQAAAQREPLQLRQGVADRPDRLGRADGGSVLALSTRGVELGHRLRGRHVVGAAGQRRCR